MLQSIMEAVGLRPKPSASQIFVSLSVTATMRTSGLSRQSTREIIRLSVGSLLFLGLLFIIIYTILLAYVDKRLRNSPNDDDRSWHYKRVKFVGRKMGSESSEYVWRYEIRDRKVIFNATELYSNEVLPYCQLQSVFRIIITSSPANTDRREEIRKTWCKPENFNESAPSWHCVFLISHSDIESLNPMIKKEMETHHDILLGTYVDSYRNLTFKVIHGFDWAVNHCPSSYIIKTDDDCFVNVGVVLDYLLNHNKITSNLYAGNFVMDKRRLKVVRMEDTKWSVPYADFPNDYYPPYASGIGYVFSIDSARQFIHETKYIKPIANEDAYVGIVMSHIGIPPTVSSRFLLSPSGLTDCNFLYVMITHGVKANQHMELMRRALLSKVTCKGSQSSQPWN